MLGLCSWGAKTGDTVAVSLVEFDFLISKSKIEEGEDFTKYINPSSRAEVRDRPGSALPRYYPPLSAPTSPHTHHA